MAEAESPLQIQKSVCEDRISSLSDDLLIHILLRVPTKDAVATKYLLLFLDNTMAPWYNAINYSRLKKCHIELYDIDLCESLVVLLSNCAKLKVFVVDCRDTIDYVPHLWNQPSSVPKCLSSHLEMFEWKGYTGREDEKELIRYILENSKCLKRAGISPKSTCSAEEEQKIIEELKSMHRVSTSELLFSVRMLFRRW